MEEGARTALTLITRTEHLCPECGSSTTTRTGFVVCKGCGLTLDREYVSGTFELGGISNISRSSSRHTALGERPSLVDGMGSDIGSYYSPGLRGFNAQQRTRIYALREQQLRTRRTDDTLFRALSEMNYICSILGLPGILRERAALLVKKARRHGCRGPGLESYSLAVVCMIVAARENEVPVTDEEIVKAFKARHHRVGLATRQRVAWWLKEQLGIQAMPNNPLIYLPRMTSAIKNSPEVRERLAKHNLDIERFSRELEVRTREALATVKFWDKGSRNPFTLAASVCYSVSVQLLKRGVLTQDIIARVCGVGPYTLRDHHKMWKRVLGKEQEDNNDRR